MSAVQDDLPIPGALQADLRSPDPEVRRQALLTLAEVKKDRKLLRVFIEVSRTDPEPTLRDLAIQLAERYVDDVSGPIEIPRTGGVAAVLDPGPDQMAAAPPPARPPPSAPPPRPPASLEEVLTSGETLTKLEAIRRATEAGDPEALALFRQRLDVERDLWVVSNLLKAVGTLGGPEDVGLLQRYLKHEDVRVQANAIEALEAIGDELSFALVAPLLSADDPRIRANAIKCLMRVDSDEALETLWRMAGSEQPASRDSALYCMSLVEHPRVPSLLVEMAAKEEHPDLLGKEVALLAEEGDRDAVGLLASLKDGRTDAVADLAADALERCVERCGVSPDEVAEAKVAFESSQLRAGRSVAGGPSGPEPAPAPLGGDGPDLPPLRSSAPPPARPQEPVAKEVALRRRKKARKKAKEPPPPATLGSFLRENPGTVGLFVFTGLFLTGSALILLRGGPEVATPDRAPPAPITIERTTKKPTKEPEPVIDEKDLIRIDAVVDHVDRRRKTALLRRDEELILALLPSAPPDDLSKGDGVVLEGKFTGKERFGAKYFRAKSLRKR